MRAFAAAFAAVAALICALPLRAATVPVTVTIDTVINGSVGDAWSQPPDFYARIWIDGAVLRTPTMWDLNSFASPAGWTFTRQVSREARRHRAGAHRAVRLRPSVQRPDRRNRFGAVHE